MSELKVGDEVLVFSVDSPARRRGEPDPGLPGEIVKVGRKLVTIHCRGWDTVFRLDTQRINDGYGHEWFATPEQVALDERHDAAMAVLRYVGLEMRSGHHLTLEQAEALAAVAGTFRQEG